MLPVDSYFIQRLSEILKKLLLITEIPKKVDSHSNALSYFEASLTIRNRRTPSYWAFNSSTYRFAIDAKKIFAVPAGVVTLRSNQQ